MQPIQEILKNPNVTLIDVRSPEEFAMEQIPNSINIPVDQIQSRLSEIVTMSAPLILFCRSGARSGMALSFLQQAGLNDVYNGGSIYDLMPLIQN
jgi:phage shock protein E